MTVIKKYLQLVLNVFCNFMIFNFIRYDVNWINISNSEDVCDLTSQHNATTTSCSKWVYDKTDFSNTAVTEVNVIITEKTYYFLDCSTIIFRAMLACVCGLKFFFVYNPFIIISYNVCICPTTLSLQGV